MKLVLEMKLKNLHESHQLADSYNYILNEAFWGGGWRVNHSRRMWINEDQYAVVIQAEPLTPTIGTGMHDEDEWEYGTNQQIFQFRFEGSLLEFQEVVGGPRAHPAYYFKIEYSPLYREVIDALGDRLRTLRRGWQHEA